MSSGRIFHFQIGELVICAEDSHGYAALAMPDAVGLSVAARAPARTPARLGVGPLFRRDMIVVS